MMDHTLEGVNGKPVTLRRFFDFDEAQTDFMGGAVGAALRDPATKSVSVRKIGRNKPCPCGSGEKFKKCCLWKVNCGVEIVTEE